MEGSKQLAELIALAAGQIDVMPAGGIGPANVAALLRATGADQVHASLRGRVSDPSLSGNARLAGAMGGGDAMDRRTTDAELVRNMRQEMDALAVTPP